MSGAGADAGLRAWYFRHITCDARGGFVARIRDKDVWKHNIDALSSNP
jgi:hypothetical protein